MAAKKFIVRCKRFENSTNVLFQMAADDFRCGTDNYQTVTEIRSTGKRVRSPQSGRMVTPVVGANGKTYHVFSDWSAVEAVSWAAPARRS